MSLPPGVVFLSPDSYFIDSNELLNSLYEHNRPRSGLFNLAAPYFANRQLPPRPGPREEPGELSEALRGEKKETIEKNHCGVPDEDEERPAKRQRRKKKQSHSNEGHIDPALKAAIAAHLALVQSHLEATKEKQHENENSFIDLGTQKKEKVDEKESNLLAWGQLVDSVCALSQPQRSRGLLVKKKRFIINRISDFSLYGQREGGLFVVLEPLGDQRLRRDDCGALRSLLRSSSLLNVSDGHKNVHTLYALTY